MPASAQQIDFLDLDALANKITEQLEKTWQALEDDADVEEEGEEQQPESEPRGTPARLCQHYTAPWSEHVKGPATQPESEPRGTPGNFSQSQADCLGLEDVLPRSHLFEDPLDKNDYSFCRSFPRGTLTALSQNRCPPLPGSQSKDETCARHAAPVMSKPSKCLPKDPDTPKGLPLAPRWRKSTPRKSTPKNTSMPQELPLAPRWPPNASKPKMLNSSALGATQQPESSLPQMLESCPSCQNLQQRLFASSTESAHAHTQRHEAMKASRRAQEAHALAEEELDALHVSQLQLAERLQATESELEHLRGCREPTEDKWRDEARAWQDAYDVAKSAATQAQQRHEFAEKAFETLDKEVRTLRDSLDQARWDLEDAQAACNATESRVLCDAKKVEEEVVRARMAAHAEENAAEIACARAHALRSRLSEDSHESRLRCEADAEEQKCVELRAEISEWSQRINAGHDALRRLQDLHREAKLRLEAQSLTANTSVERACSPCFEHTESGAELELRRRLREERLRLRNLEVEHEHLKQMQALEMERHAARTERLRLKAERYRLGHRDLQNLYRERQATF